MSVIAKVLACAISVRAYAVLLLLLAVAFTAPGAYLISLGGSPFYAIAGLFLGVCGMLLWRDDARALTVFIVLLVGVIAWAIYESGFDGWALAPRVLWTVPLALYFLFPQPRRRFASASAVNRAYPLVLAAIGATVVGGTAIGGAAHQRPPPRELAAPVSTPSVTDGDWPEYGRDAGGSRFSPLAQITPANVGNLERVWTYRTGGQGEGLPSFQVTPLKIRDRLYLCAGGNDIIALDAETGREIWRAPGGADLAGVFVNTCRGVAYFRQADGRGACSERLFTATIDRRLLAVDLETGAPCRDFGENGVVDLSVGIGGDDLGLLQITSAPQVARGRVIIGGKISDNLYVGEPSGVIRAFDAVTGALSWAWDMGHPDRRGAPPEGEVYTRGTPNSWAPMSSDDELGLVYVPMGNATPDFFGAHRRPFDEEYSSAVVALDAESGMVHWAFQTVHHDVWDYDVPAQPTLIDFPDGTPALLQPTKRGEIFLLNRRTGEPIAPVEELPVPQHGAEGEALSPTQPFSVGMPSFEGPTPSERRMWGLTPFDQMWCRIAFRRAHFEGTLTPLVTDRPTIVWPGFLGGLEWGGVAVDTDRQLMIVNSNSISNFNRLVPRAEAEARGVSARPSFDGAGWFSPQTGTPYAVHLRPFLSPLNVPCEQPPFGHLSVVDLNTRDLLWRIPFGTAEGSGPFGVASHLPITMGVPNIGGAVATRGGVFFIGASQDGYFRAYETTTGRELWRFKLPAGGQATPMTYWSGASSRQFVLIAAGGHGGIQTAGGDHVIAFALPRAEADTLQ